MSRFKPIDRGLKLLPIDLDRQLVPGTFEYALHYLIDHELDLSELESRFKNDEQGASAYSPAVLLKIILLAYSRGMIGSRRIEQACRENVLFMAISGDNLPHFTTIAGFISALGDQATKLFAQILVTCDRQGLIGREMFAIDGVKLPSNASKAKSGNRKDFLHQVEKMEKQAQRMLAKHRESDNQPADTTDTRASKKLERLQRDAKQIRQWLNDNREDRLGAKGINLLKIGIEFTAHQKYNPLYIDSRGDAA